jgi:hypothetical protein
MMTCASFLEALKDSKSAEDGNTPDWDRLPNEMWLEVFGYLNSAALNAVHLVSRKFHNLANSIVHSLDLGALFNNSDHVKRFIESKRIYKAIVNRVGFEVVKFVFDIIAEELRVAVKSVTVLKLKSCDVSPMTLHKLLKLLPNLEILELDEMDDYQLSRGEFGELKMPKLRRIFCQELDTYTNFDKVFENMKCPAITELEYRHLTQNLMTFLETHSATLKKLFIVSGAHLGSRNWIRLLEAGNFESIRLWNLMIDPHALATFLQGQTNLKHLELDNLYMTDEVLDVVFNNLPDLEVLMLPLKSDLKPLLGIHKLRKLKSLWIDFRGNFNCEMFRGLLVEVNPNLVEFGVTNIKGATKEFLSELADFIPNLKALKTQYHYNWKNIESLQTIFKKLETYEQASNGNFVLYLS